MASDSFARTSALLCWGVVVGPFYLGLGLLQAFMREGFDFARHPLSVLANGPFGWVQTANFVLSGLMVIAAAVGLARALRPRGRVTSVILGCYGAAMLAAAAFPADPVDGFPPGSPVGPPTSITTPGLLHFVFGSLGFLALAVACLAMAAVMWQRKDTPMALLSLFSGLAVFGGFFGPFVIPGFSFGMAGIWGAVVVGWAWLAAVSLYLRTTAISSP